MRMSKMEGENGKNNNNKWPIYGKILLPFLNFTISR